ncbi:MAG: hypothetical protein LW832_02925 [Parachlamydia sp.]|jgi:hypothetical protein|nr:hypothetical protein [Parachlamydia sp.]
MPLLPSYNQLKQNFLLPPYLKAKVLENRQTISAILSGKDPRKLLIVGPCSIHEAKSAMEFGRGLNDLSKEIESQFFTIMRVYCEKGRTSTGWKGYLYDPFLDGSNQLGIGIQKTRELMLELAQLNIHNGLTQLEKDMVTMDALQMQLHSIRNQKNAKTFIIKQKLQMQIGQLASQIKKQIFPKIQDELSSHLNGCYTADQLKKLSRTSYRERMAKKGKMKTTYLDLSSKTGLRGMREAIPLFKNIGTFAGKTATCINWASLGYDCLDAALNDDLERSIRIAMSGTAGIWAGTYVTAYIIGKAGTTLLVSTPLGWAVVIVGAYGAGNFVGNQAFATVDNAVSYVIKSLKQIGVSNQKDAHICGIKKFVSSSIEKISDAFIDENKFLIY